MRVLLTVVAAMLMIGCAKHNVQDCHCEACLDVKIGAMIMVGFKGVEPSAEIEKAIKDCHVGGVILFDVDISNSMGERNIASPEQLRALTNKLRSFTTRPLMIAIDQEGGKVNRLKSNYGFPSTVSAAHQGASTLDSASIWAAATAATLVSAGIDVNFAPCVDLNVNSNNPIIGARERAFSSNADSAYMFAATWVEEHNNKELLTSLKHFPGHGSSNADSHLGLVDITDTWSADELIPYRRFFDAGYKGIVMVGHLFNSNIDAHYPSSLSSKTLSGLLRDSLGFEGVIATDDMNMGAIVEHYSFAKALVLTINAGTNLIVIGNNAKQYEPDLAARCHSIIKGKVASGEIGVDKIDDSYKRLQNLITHRK